MRVVAGVANAIREARHAIAETAPLKMVERAAFDAVRDASTQTRASRDQVLKQTFGWLCGRGLESGETGHGR
jgi:hypothetical protein